MKLSFALDWKEFLLPSSSILEIVVRGTVVYLALVLLLRFVVKRQVGGVGLTDLLLVVVIADAVQNAMASEHKTVMDGLLLAVTIVFWDYALDWMGHRWPAMQRLLRAPAFMLVQDGQMLRRNMRHELVTVDELMSLLREQGVEDLAKVKAAYMEGDGHLSVIRHDGGETGMRERV